MILVPSIALHEGKVTRLTQGDYTGGTTYNQSPLDLAKGFEDAGIEWVHIVDLDGAQKGSPVNDYVVEVIAGHTNLKINFSGGIHTDGDISKIFENGALTVTCATMAVYQPELFASWVMSYGAEKIVLGADSLDGMIRVGGWLKGTQINLEEHIEHFHTRGLKYVKTADISREGTMGGPALDLYLRLNEKFPHLQIFASGGIRNLDDFFELKKTGVAGAIFGKSFYEGNITLADLSKYNSA